ncbi:hypothetical protein B0H12DRAFT_1135988 [Mycena haematopus]|nr:hypothetical protein B0H12DRAFT_1135988 [Mycena haematopus]
MRSQSEMKGNEKKTERQPIGTSSSRRRRRRRSYSPHPLPAHGRVPIHGPHTPALTATPTFPFSQRYHLWPSTRTPHADVDVTTFDPGISSNPLFTTFIILSVSLSSASVFRQIVLLQVTIIDANAAPIDSLMPSIVPRPSPRPTAHLWH